MLKFAINKASKTTMKMQCRRSALLTGAILAMLVSSASCKPADTKPEPTPPTQSETLQNVQKPPDTLKPDAILNSATDYLNSVSMLDAYKKFGFDGDVLDYINYVSKLPNAKDIVEKKLCIQDKKLTDLEKKFLAEPQKYLQEMYEYNLSEMAKTDPDMASKFRMLPYNKNLDANLVEASEDVLYLAMNPQNRGKLIKIYGKGIERKMWPVALERLVYKATQSEFDVNDPLVGLEMKIFADLADFQEKYNTEMDQDGVAGPKPKILGMNYFHEPLGSLTKDGAAIKFDYALIRWVLGCDAVRIWGFNTETVSKHIQLAQEEGLDVWLQFYPFFVNPKMDLDTYKAKLSIFAKEAEKYKVKVFFVGNELDYLDNMPKRSEMPNALSELAEIARKNFSGKITYADWQSPLGELDWTAMDIISKNMYLATMPSERFRNTLVQLKKNNKPVFVTEVGSLTVAEADADRSSTYPARFPVHHDPEAQAKRIDNQLKIIYNIGVDGIFICCWDEYAYASGKDYDKNKLGFGIWDYVAKEPKLSFWSVYKYFRE